MKKWFVRLLLLLVALGATWYFYPRTIPDYGRKILVFSKTTEFRHASIPKGIETLTELGRRGKFNVLASEDADTFRDESLQQFHAVVFLNTTGDVLNVEQQDAMERYIEAGGGFVGIHSASDTEWREDPWFWYQRLVGGVFDGHPENSEQMGTLTVTEKTQAATKMLPDSWQTVDEWYDFKRLSKGINVVMEVDEASYTGGKMGAYHPVAWYREFDGGRSFYTALGHTDTTYDNTDFQTLLLGALEWAMADGRLDYSKSKPESWRFTRTALDSGLDEPVKIAFSPAGELYYLERKGKLRRYDFAQKKSITVAELPVFTEFESGMLGLAFDPDFNNNHWVYLYRSTPRDDPAAVGETVLSRFQLVDGELALDSEQRLLSMPAANNELTRASHAGGDMQFDKAGKLWLSTGDDTVADDVGRIDDRPGQSHNDAARSAANTQDLRGKILRIQPLAQANDQGLFYAIPEGNLFAEPAQGRPEIYAMGLRNPFTIAFDDRTQTLYWGEVGPDGREPDDRGPKGYDEFNRTVVPGNFGWPYVIANNLAYHYYDYDSDEALDAVDVKAPENRSRNNTGAKVLPPAQPAWMYYPYDDSDKFFELGTGGRNAIVGKPYYSSDYAPSEYKFPAWMDGKLLIGDFMRNWLKVVNVDAQGNVESITPLIEHPFSAPLDMAFGPDGALYVVEYGSTWFQQNPDAYLSRIEYYAGENPPPVAVASVSKSEGAAPLKTTFNASASYDRGKDSGIATYHWELHTATGQTMDLGDQEIQDAVIDQVGEHVLVLTVSDDAGLQHSTQLRLAVGNERPKVEISVSGNRSFFVDSERLDYAVSVTDLEDGSTADGSLAAQDIKVSFDYLGSSEDLASALAGHQIDPTIAGRTLVTSGSDCHGCHQLDSESVGPALTAIGQRYAQREDALDYLKRVIAQGGRGQWPGSHAMPAHSSLSVSQLDAASRFILSLGGAQTGRPAGLPLQGELQFSGHEKDVYDAILNVVMELKLGAFQPGRYLLHASYADKGGDAPPLQGNASLTFVHPRQMSDFLQSGPGTTSMDLPENVTTLIVDPDNAGENGFAYGYIPDIDLTGISTITVGVGAISAIAVGGTLELRLDDPASAAVASIPVETSLGYDREKASRSLDVSAIDGVHTLYLGAPAAGTETTGKPAFAIITIQFEGSATQ